MAANQTYRYDAEHFQYVPVKRNLKFYLRRLFFYLVPGLAIGTLLVYLFFWIYDSPATQSLGAENREMAGEIQQNNRALYGLSLSIDSLREQERNIYRTALDAEPIEDETETRRHATASDISEQNLDRLEAELAEMNQRLNRNTYTSAVILDMANMRQDELRNMPAIRPVKGEIISGFGMRKHPVYKNESRMHPGIDFMADEGTAVMATGNGTVSAVGNGTNGMGNYLEINHGNGYVSRYAHLSKVKVYSGQRVKRGDVVALSGASGLCKGPHLFYQILKNSQPVDPIDYFYNDLTPEQFLEFKRIASQNNESMN